MSATQSLTMTGAVEQTELGKEAKEGSSMCVCVCVYCDHIHLSSIIEFAFLFSFNPSGCIRPQWAMVQINALVLGPTFMYLTGPSM